VRTTICNLDIANIDYLDIKDWGSVSSLGLVVGHKQST
jgi:hypothetical protein